MDELDGGFSITLYKDNLSPEKLFKLGLNNRQIKAVLLVIDKGKITNSGFQDLCLVSKATATRDLTELVDRFKIFKRSGEVGAGTSYDLIGS